MHNIVFGQEIKVEFLTEAKIAQKTLIYNKDGVAFLCFIAACIWLHIVPH